MKVVKKPGPHVVSVGSVQVRIYHTPTRRCDSFTLSYYQDGQRKRPTFSTLERAKQEAQLIARRLATSDADVLTLRSADRAAYLRARELLEPLGIPLESATADYVEAKRKLSNTPLQRAVDFYLIHSTDRLTPRPVSDLIEELLVAKQNDGMSERYLSTLKHYLGKFSDGFSCNIADVRGQDVDQWLRKMNLAPRTRNNIRACIQVLFTFAITRKYLPKNHDEISSVTQARDKGGEISIFTPDELQEMLDTSRPEMVPFLTLCAFAGVRHAEVLRLDWGEIRFDENVIEIRAAKSKTASRRTIPLLPNLKSWLAPYAQHEGAVCPLRNAAFEISQLVRKINAARRERGMSSKFAWRQNALRHSFISYRLAVIQNTAQVALEAGNSPQMIFQHYRELVRPTDAQKWFAIVPR